MTVSSWGTGRVDYSQNVEESVVPIIRSYQVNAYAVEEFTLDAGEEEDVVITLPFSEDAESHFIAFINVSVDANVLISVAIRSAGSNFIREFAYQNVEVQLPQTLGLSEVTLRIKNHSDISIRGIYSHNGVQGTEKIMPTPVV